MKRQKKRNHVVIYQIKAFVFKIKSIMMAIKTNAI